MYAFACIFNVDTWRPRRPRSRSRAIAWLRLPKSVALEAEVDEGDTVDVSVKNGAIVIRPSRPMYFLNRLVAKITSRNRHDESDWGAPVGYETW